MDGHGTTTRVGGAAPILLRGGEGRGRGFRCAREARRKEEGGNKRQRNNQFQGRRRGRKSDKKRETHSPRDPPDGRLCRSLTREVTLEALPDEVGLLGLGGVNRPPLSRLGELLIGDGSLGMSLETVDPRVTDSIGELLLLTPEDRIGEVGLKNEQTQEKSRSAIASSSDDDPTLAKLTLSPSGAISKAFLKMYFSMMGLPSLSFCSNDPLLKVLSSGRVERETSRNSLSRKGTRASSPQAMVDL